MTFPLHHKAAVFNQCARMGFKNILADKILLLGSSLVYCALMLLYAGVIRLIPSDTLAPFGYTHEQMIWYIGTAEYIVFSGTEWWFKELQNDINTSQIHLSLLRPVSNTLLRVATWFGEGMARSIMLFPVYFLIMIVLTEGNTPSVSAILGIVASLPLATVMLACGAYLVGGSCLWFIQSEPAFWIWQKAIFLLGAMMWPMSFYPEWAQIAMWFTPFPGILANGANWVLDNGPASYALSAMHQTLWAVAFAFLLKRFDAKILRHMQTTGA